MTGRFVFTEDAEAHLEEIIGYLSLDSEEAAVAVRNALYEGASRLAEMPEMGHKREDLTDRALKFWSVYSYLVVYDPASSPITIIAVLHGSRDVGRVLQDLENR